MRATAESRRFANVRGMSHSAETAVVCALARTERATLSTMPISLAQMLLGTNLAPSFLRWGGSNSRGGRIPSPSKKGGSTDQLVIEMI